MSWLTAVTIGLIPAAVMLISTLMIFRKRRWGDLKVLAKPATMPPEHLDIEPKKVRDMVEGDEGYVQSSEIVTSKKDRRVFVAWDARLQEPPQHPNSVFAPIRIKRLERGFSLTVTPSDQFRSGSLPWGIYAPVTEILQAADPLPSSGEGQGRSRTR